MRYLQHFRRHSLFGNVQPTGGKTVAIEVTPTELKIGIARCHHPDVFSRKIGNKLATEKLEQSPRIVTIEEFREFAKKDLQVGFYKAEAVDEFVANMTFDKFHASFLLHYANNKFKS